MSTTIRVRVLTEEADRLLQGFGVDPASMNPSVRRVLAGLLDDAFLSLSPDVTENKSATIRAVILSVDEAVQRAAHDARHAGQLVGFSELHKATAAIVSLDPAAMSIVRGVSAALFAAKGKKPRQFRR